MISPPVESLKDHHFYSFSYTGGTKVRIRYPCPKEKSLIYSWKVGERMTLARGIVSFNSVLTSVEHNERAGLWGETAHQRCRCRSQDVSTQ
jgi:hypothetical protein